MADPLNDALDALDASVDALAARVKSDDDAAAADHKNLMDQIAALQALVDQGNNNPAIVQRLTDLKAKLDAMENQMNPPPPPPPDNGGANPPPDNTNPTT